MRQRQYSATHKQMVKSDIDFNSSDRVLSIQTVVYGLFIQKISSKGNLIERRFYLNESNPLLLMWTSRKHSYKRSSANLTQLKSIERSPENPSFLKCSLPLDESRFATLIFTKKQFSLYFKSEQDLLLFLSGVHYLINEKIYFKRDDLHTIETMKFDIWVQADRNRSASLDHDEIKKMINKLNIHYNNEQVADLFNQFDIDSNKLIDREEFDKMLETLMNREEISAWFSQYASEKSYLRRKDFKRFIKDFQSDDDHGEIFSLFSVENEDKKKIMTLARFRDYLLNPEKNSVVNKANSTVSMDMTQPLTHYFIASSHNTYLEGNQLTGVSSTDQYAKVLLDGCRCIEIDTWDGDTEPKVTHGHTLVSHISLREVIKEIKQSAFITSPYPVIISIENHCSKRQINQIAQIFKEILGSDIYVPDSYLLSPESLKYKFIIKAKLKPKQQSSELSQLIGLKGCKFGFDQGFNEISSIKESQMKKLVNQHGGGEIIKFFGNRLVRIYPKASRINSSNYICLDQWVYGANLAAINYQKRDEGWLLNHAWFIGNGKSGFVLKPSFMRDSSVLFDFNAESLASPTIELIVEVISAFNLPRPAQNSNIPSPCVEVSMLGVPKDCLLFTTRTIERNGLNPVWSEKITFPLRVFELAVICFKILSEGAVLGLNFVPLFYLNPGIRALNLFDSSFSPVKNSALLCRFIINPIDS